MNDIKYKFLVMSGKGGVGKSSMAVNLALWLSQQGLQVGLLDVDIHGPSVPRLLQLDGRRLQGSQQEIEAIAYSPTLKVMSVGFMLDNSDRALIVRGPMKHNMIQQFVQNVLWGTLDCLVVDCPPGTGDEPLSIAQLLEPVNGAMIITTPQQLAIMDVKKCVTFCRQMKIPITGVIENMSGFICPHCSKRTDIFAVNGGKTMAQELGIPFLGAIPLNPEMVMSADSGKPFIQDHSDHPIGQALMHAFGPVLDQCKDKVLENDA
ncbi:P-loop NTPase [Planctomycetota bacterium]